MLYLSNKKIPLIFLFVILLAAAFILFHKSLIQFSIKKKHTYSISQEKIFSYKDWMEKCKNSIKKISLKNGMSVLMFKIPIPNKVFVQLTFNVGAADEEQSEKGFAHVIEHMIFKGTNKLSEQDVGTIFRNYGSTLKGSTIFDSTSFFYKCNLSNWQFLLPILAECTQNTNFKKRTHSI